MLIIATKQFYSTHKSLKYKKEVPSRKIARDAAVS